MNVMTNNALNAYAKVGVETGVETATPHQLILMLYEGALNALASAKMHLQRNEIALKGQSITKAIAIIDEGLKLSLDLKAGGELAQNMKALYDYMCSRLLVANLKNDEAMLDEVARLLTDLKVAWEAIGKPAAIAPNQQTRVDATSTQTVSRVERQVALSYGKV